jgi:hypothetical protein
MAHYIAELITRAETSGPDQRTQAEEQCATEILRLWAHRAGLPAKNRPLESFAPLYQALERLDPEGPNWSFYRTFNSDSAPDGEDTEVNALLSIALNLENSIRDVVRTLIIEAASRAATREGKWLQIAEGLDDDESIFRRALWQLKRTQHDDSVQPEQQSARVAAAVQSLETAITVCESVRSALEATSVTDSGRERQESRETH